LTTQPGLQGNPIYLDYNATTPIDPAVVDAMLPYLARHFGNASSTHSYGRATRQGIDTAREQVAQLLNCASSEVIFTGCGSDTNLRSKRHF
jgi:cysteine desulfurase